MTVNNKLDKTFGTAGSFAGVVISLFGIYACFYSWIGVTTIIVGVFLAFTHTSAKIDFKNKKVKFSNNLFGIFGVGYWSDIKSSMSLRIQKTIKTQTSYSNSNRKNTETFKDFRIILINENGKEIIALQKFEKKEDAEKGLEKLSQELNIKKQNNELN